MYKIENQLKFEDFIFPYGKLNENNRWIKLSKIIPWDEIEIKYAKKFRKKGNLEIMLSIFQRSDKIKFRKRKQYGQRRSLL